MKLWDFKIGRSSKDTYRIILKNNPEVLKVSNQFRIDYKISESEEVSIDRSVLNSYLKEKIENFDEVFFDPGLNVIEIYIRDCLLYTSPSPRDLSTSRMPSSA